MLLQSATDVLHPIVMGKSNCSPEAKAPISTVNSLSPCTTVIVGDYT
ncbi:hypothetical protein PA08_1736 [Cutibacterium modestum P08]|nr:hypothetical protein PA08_1736 [Cutibacterium modestum P08]